MPWWLAVFLAVGSLGLLVTVFAALVAASRADDLAERERNRGRAVSAADPMTKER